MVELPFCKGASGIEPDAGVEPATLRLSKGGVSYTSDRGGDLVVNLQSHAGIG
jgi:hypothetical protein